MFPLELLLSHHRELRRRAQRHGRSPRHRGRPEIEPALRPTLNIVDRSFFASQLWTTNHSALPTFNLRRRTHPLQNPGEVLSRRAEKDLEDRLARAPPVSDATLRTLAKRYEESGGLRWVSFAGRRFLRHPSESDHLHFYLVRGRRPDVND